MTQPDVGESTMGVPGKGNRVFETSHAGFTVAICSPIYSDHLW